VTTLREQLGAALPRVPLKAAWKKVILVSRRRKKAGLAAPLASRQAVDRLLDQAADDRTTPALKGFLRELHDASGEQSEDQALESVEGWYRNNAPRIAHQPVELHVHLAHPLIAKKELDGWLGTEMGRVRVDPSEAALWVHRLHGLDVGGVKIRVSVDLLEGEVLPAVGRKARGRTGNRGQSSWLPFSDVEGQFSLTPRPIAEAHAAALEPKSTIIDPFCGLGGDAIAMALAGHSVLASDSSLARVNLAEQNAAHFDAQTKIEFSTQEATHAIGAGLTAHPGACLFLDPPWGGPDWNRDSMDFSELIGSVPGLERAISRADRVLIKLPRNFPTHTLPNDAHVWTARLGLCTTENPPIDRLKTLFAYGEIRV
jgi:trimethylguanosine synthase